jgi:unsaturated rhamnogalacturonyl hydrolase
MLKTQGDVQTFLLAFARRSALKHPRMFNVRLPSVVVSSLLVVLILATARHARADQSLPKEFSGSSPLEWSVRMADSEISRRGDSLAWKEGGRARWDYTAGLFTRSLLKLDERVHEPAYVKFAERAIGSFISTNGGIQGYRADEYNLDNINPGKTVLALYLRTKEDRYKKNARLLHRQFHSQPRVSEGGFWHKQRYTNQMWLDGIYMASPFYAQYAQLFNEPADFDDVAKQILTIAAHT